MLRIMMICLLSTRLIAGGWGFHLISTEKALETLPQGPLRALLTKELTPLLNGSIYPDGGYVYGQRELAEWTHKYFLNPAFSKLEKQNCKNFRDLKCQKKLAFLFGIIAHIMGDCNFDRYFLRGLAKAEFDGDLDKAQNFSDLKFDTVVIKGYGLDTWVPKFYQPKEFVCKIYQENNFHVTQKDLSEMQSYQRVLYTALTSYATHSGERISHQSPWGTANFKEGVGGVEDTAKKIAEIWQKSWAIIEKSKSKTLPRFVVQGKWPDLEIKIKK